MAIFTFEESATIGTVFSVDTATIIIKVDELDKLRKLQVNHLIAVKRKVSDDENPVTEDLGISNFLLTENIVKVNLIGTLIDKHGEKENVFKRTLDTVP